jgi:dolichyl-phosphate beta-glucosyltransferase
MSLPSLPNPLDPPPSRAVQPTLDLSVVIPAYNEAARIAGTLERIGAFLDGRPGASEIIVADDGSSDGTPQVAKAALPDDARLRVLALGRNQGKGAAVRAGVLAARGRRVLFSDADLSTPIEDLEVLEAALDQGSAVAIGSRALADSQVMVRQPWYRQTMGKVFNLLVQMLALPGIHDSQCGFKLFRHADTQRLFSAHRLPGFSFDVEILFLARKLGLGVAEVPVHWYDSPASRVHPVLDSARMLRDLLRLRWDWLRGRYL